MKVDPVKVSREEFMKALDAVAPGTSNRNIVDQATCFVLKGGQVMTYNEEVACRAKSGLPKQFTGAVEAGPLRDILRKLPDEFVRISCDGKRFVIHGKGRKTGIAMQSEALLPVDQVETPTEEQWKKISPDFTDAVQVVEACASKNMEFFTSTCIHIHPEFMEACDNAQLTRYELKTRVKRPVLVRQTALRHVPRFDFTDIALTDKWLHFRTADGTLMSCQVYTDKFKDMTDLVKSKGTPTVLPKALGEVADRCNVFSSNNADNNMVQVEIRNGKLQVRGEGDAGFHEEVKRLRYGGKPMTFRIAPALLSEIVKRHTDCQLSKNRLIVNGGKFTYVVCLQEV